ncbi:MAG: rhodanese-like domain-containing protein [Anaerolineaceae bacterium]|nr:MAG: rhodanese-like domain-containing protein [Anaerolineaceae bacterium]
MSFETIKANDVVNYIGRPNVLIIDLRDREDYMKGHIPSAVNIPYDNLEHEKHRLSRNTLLILYCDRGHISLLAARDLMKYGYQIKSMHGGIQAYYGKLV